MVRRSRLLRSSVRPLLSLFALATSSACTSAIDREAAPADDEPIGRAEQAEVVDGFLAAAPAATRSGAETYDVVVQGANNTLWHRSLVAGVWGPWRPIESDGTTTLLVTAKPAVVSHADGELDVFVRHNDGSLWTRRRDSAGWGRWKNLGGWLADGPAAASDGAGHVDVFVQGAGQSLWRRAFRQENVTLGHCSGVGAFFRCEGGSDGWSGWQQIGSGATSAPAAVSSSPGRIDLVVRGSSNGIVHRASVDGGASWSAPLDLGGAAIGAPTIASRRPANVQVYARTTGGALRGNAMVDGTFGGWGTLRLEDHETLPLTSDPAAVANPGIVCDHLFGRDQNNQLWHRGCGEISDVRVTNLATGTRMQRTFAKGTNRTLNVFTLGPVANEARPAGSTTRISLVDARTPRELVVFDRYVPTDKTVASPWGPVPFTSWIAGEMGVEYARLAAYPYAPFAVGIDWSPFARSLDVPFQVKAMRLIDHGSCATRIPYFWDFSTGRNTEPNALLSNYVATIVSTLQKRAAEQGVGVDIAAVRLEPTFMDRGAYDLSSNDDGIALHMKFTFRKSTIAGAATIEIRVDANYAFRMVDGAPALIPVGHTHVQAKSNFLFDVGKILTDLVNGLGEAIGGALTGLDGDPSAPTLVPKIPSTGSIESQFWTLVTQVIPAQFRERTLNALYPKSSGKVLSTGALCNGAGAPETERTSCFDQRMSAFRITVRKQLEARGVPAAQANERATDLVSRLRRESFDCRPVPDVADRHACYWHPHLSRVNLLPDQAELVWFDGAKSPDFEIAEAFRPGFDRAVCTAHAPSADVRATKLRHASY